eukprot:2706610-Rhodomonas_salina.4
MDGSAKAFCPRPKSPPRGAWIKESENSIEPLAGPLDLDDRDRDLLTQLTDLVRNLSESEGGSGPAATQLAKRASFREHLRRVPLKVRYHKAFKNLTRAMRMCSIDGAHISQSQIQMPGWSHFLSEDPGASEMSKSTEMDWPSLQAGGGMVRLRPASAISVAESTSPRRTATPDAKSARGLTMTAKFSGQPPHVGPSIDLTVSPPLSLQPSSPGKCRTGLTCLHAACFLH